MDRVASGAGSAGRIWNRFVIALVAGGLGWWAMYAYRTGWYELPPAVGPDECCTAFQYSGFGGYLIVKCRRWERCPDLRPAPAAE